LRLIENFIINFNSIMRNIIKSIILSAFLILQASATIQKIDCVPLQDTNRILCNPDKGWYHHYYDNCLEKYLGDDKDIEKIPNLHHLFLRFAWSFLEPEEGKFNWALIDQQVEKWSAKGVKISLSITAQETGEPYATPKWVVDAGAKGGFYNPYGSHKVFEPEFDDPIFLQKLENLQKAIAKRYDGKDFIATITIASIGNWGEGHVFFTSKKKVPVEVIKKHIDIYAKYFKKSQIVIGDDYLAANHTPEEILDLREYVKAHKISYRDDSILVKWTYFHNPKRLSFLNPEYFADAAEYAPTTLELEHYAATLKSGTWKGANGVEHGADVLRKVVEMSQCTYLGYHGYAKDYLRDNPDFLNEMANKLGYWFFIDEIVFDPTAGILEVTWNNRGAARAYEPYRVYFKIKQRGANFEKVVRIKEANPREFLSGITRQTYGVDFKDVPSGEYEISVCMKKKSKQSTIIELGFKEDLRDKDGFYKLGTVRL